MLSLNQRTSSGFGTPSVILQVKVTLFPSVTGPCGPDRLNFGRTSKEKKEYRWFRLSYDFKMTYKHQSAINIVGYYKREL